MDSMQGTRRLDRWLRQDYPNLPQGIIEKLLRNKVIRVNGQRASASQSVCDRDIIKIHANLDQYRASDMAAPNWFEHWDWLKKHVLYEDTYLLALNKPAGLAVQGGSGVDLHLDGILKSLGAQQGIPYRLVHRLDRDTSGVWVVAKTLGSAQFLTNRFRDRQIHKVYHAIIEGRLPKTSGRITIPIEKKQSDAPQQEASTLYQVLRTGKSAQHVELCPETGRMHQLRIHMSRMGTPIWGDTLYHSIHVKDPLHLHAHTIRIPLEDRMLEIQAPLPAHIQSKINRL
jgi:23S rRNA pseudouridine955/2504/2580 synthase